MLKKDIKNVFTTYLPVITVLIFILFPFVWTFITSIKPETELYTNKIQILPVNSTWANYNQVLGDKKFILGMINSSIISVMTALLSLLVSLMAAYACSRYDFKGKDSTLIGFLLIHMFPPILLLMPLFVMMKGFGLINTHASLVIAYCTYTIPFSVWLLTGYLNNIPIELEEAAIIDGCNRITAFIRVVFPLAAPGMIAATIYIFIYSWNEFLFAVMFTGQQTRTVPIVIYSFIGEHVVNWGLLTSGGIITGLPVIALFIIIQKKLVEGLTSGAVKG